MSYIVVTDTVFEGRVAAWRDDNGKPALYDTSAEAEADCMEDDWVEPVFVHEDGSIVGEVDGRVYWRGVINGTGS